MRSESVNVGGRMVPPSEAGTQGAAEADRITRHQRNYGGGGGGGSGGCFPRGTRISTPSGSMDIGEVQVGDYVSSVIPTTGQIVAHRVLKVAAHPSRKIWHIRFDDGSEVRTTATHSFRVGKRWVTAARVRAGDHMQTLGCSVPSSARTVAESCGTEDMQDVFNLIVEGENNFIADDVLAHSFTHFKAVRGFVWNCLAMIRRSRRHTSCATLRMSIAH